MAQDVPQSNIVVRLVKGGSAIDVFSATIQGQADAASVYSFYVNQLAQGATGFGGTQPTAMQIGGGIAAARGTYTGAFGDAQVEGEVTTLVIGATGWILDVWSSAGTLPAALPEAHQMIDNLQVVQ